MQQVLLPVKCCPVCQTDFCEQFAKLLRDTEQKQLDETGPHGKRQWQLLLRALQDKLQAAVMVQASTAVGFSMCL
jgi:hypothetical protein